MPYEREMFGIGYKIVHIHRDKPPKIFRNMGFGEAFFTNSKFGDLALFIKMISEGNSITDASKASGVLRIRGGRFLNVFMKYTGKKFYCSCGKQIPHVGNCKGTNRRKKCK